MKKVILAVVILAIIITAGILENVYVDKIFGELDSRLADLNERIISRDETALEKMEDMQEWWEKHRRYAELFVYSPDIRAFSVALGET